MIVEVEYGTTYLADTTARTVVVKSNSAKIRAGKRIAKVLQIADEKAAAAKQNS